MLAKCIHSSPTILEADGGNSFPLFKGVKMRRAHSRQTECYSLNHYNIRSFAYRQTVGEGIQAAYSFQRPTQCDLVEWAIERKKCFRKKVFFAFMVTRCVPKTKRSVGGWISQLLLLLPDGTFHNCKASKSVDQRISRLSEVSILRLLFWCSWCS